MVCIDLNGHWNFFIEADKNGSINGVIWLFPPNKAIFIVFIKNSINNGQFPSYIVFSSYQPSVLNHFSIDTANGPDIE